MSDDEKRDLQALLSEIFALACEAMAAKLREGEITAADLNAIRGFLKDNNVTALPAEGSPLGAMKEALEQSPYSFPFAPRPQGTILDPDDPVVLKRRDA